MWNHRDEQGHVLDLYERPMWDADVNHDTFATRQTLPPASRVFCRSCLANQTIVANLLANYLSEDDESTDAERMAAYPAYRQSLEARYPLVCEACAPRVEAQLEKSHQHVRSEALRSWIARHAAATTALAERDEAPVVRRSICLACLPTWWDCRAAHKDRLDARAVRYEARGQRAWQAAQLSLWLVRLGSVYASLQGTHTTTLSALGLLHATLCIITFASYRLVPQAPLHLALRATTPVAGAPPDPVAAPPPLAALSLADEPRVSAPLDTLWQESASSDAMDVDPEPAPPRRHGGPGSLRA
ncbi:hypothetical protein MEQU1_000457 [Malassezia equina]|uniref:Ima1 N-terminal domain-containing protein n=1 Tax=Malassezia equina TaxID=1381935 RepID=A0AAF0IXI7_9BASI|nr:hypothetical protein MEQU1_000457 [Malassezia equina]